MYFSIIETFKSSRSPKQATWNPKFSKIKMAEEKRKKESRNSFLLSTEPLLENVE
jgi:hypothetical protein